VIATADAEVEELKLLRQVLELLEVAAQRRDFVCCERLRPIVTELARGIPAS
jgi:hypothetical protein